MLPRLAYGLVFCLALPILLVLWAHALDHRVHLPIVQPAWLGAPLALAGVALMAWAMAQLRVESGGLPMNAFPPAKRAVGGPFAWLNHPIYIGFVLACAGSAILFQSPAGLWVVTPTVAAACFALVAGYEAHATLHRLGPRPTPPLIRLAPPTDDPPDLADRLSILPLIFLPWLLGYLAIGHLPVPDAIDARLPFERAWPVLQWTEWPYAATYPFVILAPAILTTRRRLRTFAQLAVSAMVIAFWCYLVIPLISPPRPFTADSLAGRLLELERIEGLDGRAAFPSFHVCWSLIAAWAWSTRGPLYAAAAWTLALIIAASCVTTGMHAIADVLTGGLLFVVILRLPDIWRIALRLAQAVANTWLQWRLGPVRILIHALYAGLAAAAGIVVARSLAGPDTRLAILAIAVAGLLGAALWGQALARNSGLARPFGYFGHIAGVAAAVALVAAFGGSAWQAGAAVAAAAPFAHAIGRLRCLVQGCCHGRPTLSAGIVHTDPRSRVCRHANLGGRPIHPTPLYSIIGNLLLAGLMLRLWSVAAPASFIVGSYLILQGLARFVEEHFRGEPKTPVLAGLRLYQWLAVASVLAGVFLTALPSSPVAWPQTIDPAVPLDTLLIAALYAIAMGVDFPDSRARFGRLA